MAKSKDTKDPIAWVNHKAEEALQRLDQKAAETPAQLWLPGFDIGASLCVRIVVVSIDPETCRTPIGAVTLNPERDSVVRDSTQAEIEGR